jgi:hypothetical protein
VIQISLKDKLSLFRKIYCNFGGNKKGSGINESYLSNPLFIGCKQWHFTDIELFSINELNWTDKTTWGVVINHELVAQLMLAGIPSSNIIFYSDCQFRTNIVRDKLNLSKDNIVELPSAQKEFKKFAKDMKKISPKVDYVLNNVPFGMFKEFKELAKNLAKEKALIISGSRDYHNNEDAFSNVEFYKYLGKCFPTAKIVASLVIVNPKHTSNEILIEDSSGKFVSVQRNHAVAPANDPQEWIWAQSVLDLKLPGYNQFETGKLYRKDAKFDPNGINVAFTMGKAKSDFDHTNYGKSYSEIQLPTTAWSKVEKSQMPLLGGYGQHAIGISYMASIGHLGNVKYLAPDIGCGQKTYWHPVNDQQDAQEAIKYLNHPEVIRLVKVLKSCVASNSKETFKLIPHHFYAKEWIKNYD